jgi:hypothetical protein
MESATITNPETNAGVVVTLVPETDSGPYMAKLGEQRYFKRSGDSFYQMEHFDLEDMFGRRQKPKIEILFEEGKAEGGIEELVVFLFNQGRAIARHAGFVISLNNVEIIRVDHGMNNISAINSGRPVISHNNQSVIHPNGIRVNLGSIHFRRIDPSQAIEGEVTLYCEGTQSLKRFLTVAAAAPAVSDEVPKPEP